MADNYGKGKEEEEKESSITLSSSVNESKNFVDVLKPQDDNLTIEKSSSSSNNNVDDKCGTNIDCVGMVDITDNELINKVNSFSQSIITDDNCSTLTDVSDNSCSNPDMLTISSYNCSEISNDDVSAIEEDLDECDLLKENKNDDDLKKQNTNNNILDTPCKEKNKKLGKGMITSTPCHQNDLSKNEYIPPARSILKKWRPRDINHTLVNNNAGDISAIESVKTHKSDISTNNSIGNKSNLDSFNDKNTTTSSSDEFEDEFNNLYSTIFGDDSDINDTVVNNKNSLYNNVAKLELYRSNIVQQNVKANEKFNEIISEISSSMHFNDDDDDEQHFNTIDEILNEENNDCRDLSVIPEEELSNEDNDKTLTEQNVTVKLANENQNMCDILKTETMDDEDKLLSDTEVCKIEVFNGANSITYLNYRELTLDEEEALLNDDGDMLSINCSDIDSTTPRTDDTIVAASTDNINKELSVVKNEPVVNTESIASTSKSSVNIPVTDNVSESASTSNTSKTTTAIVSQQIQPIPSSQAKYDRNAPFISNNPEENEDNNNPDWEHLRRLSNDKERYKALRDRWHSVVIPDPNLDLTTQTCRNKRILKDKRDLLENKKKGSFVRENFNSNVRKHPHSSGMSGDAYGEPDRKRMKCTVVYEESMKDVVRKFEFKRFCLYKEMDRKLADLAIEQERYYYLYSRMICNKRDLRALHLQQTKEVMDLKRVYMEKIQQAENHARSYIMALETAVDEVLTFHKFYHELDSNCVDNSSMFLTDEQVHELIEIEVMLENYPRFYAA